MIYVLAGGFALWLLSGGLRAFVTADPARLAVMLKRLGAGLCASAAVFCLGTGRIGVGMGLFGLAGWLVGWRGMGQWSAATFSRKTSPPATSRVRSAMIDMELDHGSGAMRGTILAGSFEGRTLDGLSRAECEALHGVCAAGDPQGAQMLEAYLDRRFPGWRETAQADADTRGASTRGSGAMSQDEAYEVLGLRQGAARDDIARAHRDLMKKLHPDHGGSTHLAARVNEAKDILLRRHS